jgi:hypothetical protein
VQQIRTIQFDDARCTPINDYNTSDTSLGGVTLRIQKFCVDGTDPEDQVLTVELEVEVGQEPYKLKFSGNQFLSLQSLQSIRVGDKAVRFAAEIRTYQISLMMASE